MELFVVCLSWILVVLGLIFCVCGCCVDIDLCIFLLLCMCSPYIVVLLWVLVFTLSSSDRADFDVLSTVSTCVTYTSRLWELFC